MSDNASGAADLLDAPDAATALADRPPGDTAITAPAEKPWFDGIGDTELKGWVGNKNFKSAEDAMVAYRNLETVLGRDKLPVPKDENDVEGYGRIYKALGRPDTPEGYGLEKLEGGDEAFARSVAGWLHEAGVGQRQAQSLGEKWNAFMTEQTKAAQTAFETQSARDLADLRGEWGVNAEANLEHFRRGARQFGVDKDSMKSIEIALGTRKAMELFAKIGQGLGEDQFIEGNTVKTFGMTVEGATARKNALMADKEWAGRYLTGGAAEKAEMEKLLTVISGGKPQ